MRLKAIIKTYMMPIVFVFMVGLILSCAANKVWTKPTSFTQEEFARDKYECLQQSQQQSGSAFVNQSFGFADSGSVTNQNLFITCMNAKGWSLMDKNNLQTTVDQNSTEFKQKKAIYDDTMKKFTEKHKAICAKPEYAQIVIKTSCNAKDITFEQIADNTKITPEQKTILPKYRTEVDAVSKERYEYMHTLTSSKDRRLVDYLESLQSEVDKYNLDLLNGLITWGEYNQRRKDQHVKSMSEIKKILQ
jgi:hypothetical protein